MLELVIGWCTCNHSQEPKLQTEVPEGAGGEETVEKPDVSGVRYQDLVALLNWKTQLSELGETQANAGR